MFEMTTLGLYTLLGTPVKHISSLELVLYKGRSIHNAAERCTLCFHVLLAHQAFHCTPWRHMAEWTHIFSPFLTLCDFVITPCDQMDRLFLRRSGFASSCVQVCSYIYRLQKRFLNVIYHFIGCSKWQMHATPQAWLMAAPRKTDRIVWITSAVHQQYWGDYQSWLHHGIRSTFYTYTLTELRN